MKKRFFGLLTWSHRWIGMTIGLVMVYLAVTGAGQSFKAQLEPVFYASLLTAPACDRLPLDTLVGAAREAHPGANADSIRFHPEGEETAQVRFSDRQAVYVNPCSSSVTGEQPPFAGFFGTLEYIHRMMFFADFRLWSGTVTLICFVFLVIGGLTLWWPRSWREAKRSLKIDNRLKGMAFMLTLHKTFGLYAWVALLVITFFGNAMAFDWVKQGVYRATGSEMPLGGRNGPPQGAQGDAAGDAKPALSLEALWQKAIPVLDGPRDVTIRLPRRKGDPVQMTVIEASAPHPRARSELVLDGATGEVRRFTPYAKTSLGNKVYNWGVALHTGQAGGWIGALIGFCASLAVPVLAYSGIMSWWRRRKSRKALGLT
ncbi:MAG TPA: PepSY-associated TM helix domain-containing protein [Magnetospirillaceae bacterium]|nr:PepSY-associated TM helix domain-containing protein [Magnetospirillaceae bacterium]